PLPDPRGGSGLDRSALVLGREVMIFDSLLDLFRAQAITIPPLDGALKPNTRLEDAGIVAKVAACDNLVADGSWLWLSSGERLLRLQPDRPGAGEEVARFPSTISALARAPTGVLAIGLDDGTILCRQPDGSTGALEKPSELTCPTALAFDA